MLGDRNKEEVVAKQKVLPERPWTEDRWVWGWERKGREVNASTAGDLGGWFVAPALLPGCSSRHPWLRYTSFVLEPFTKRQGNAAEQRGKTFMGNCH